VDSGISSALRRSREARRPLMGKLTLDVQLDALFALTESVPSFIKPLL
jgi:hypothetical protein